jgi:fluoride exporter
VTRLLLLALAGGVGTLLRHGVTAAGARLGAATWLATWTVNVVGCFVLGALVAATTKGAIATDARIVLGAGLCGGFTTYSTFNAEALALVDGGHFARAALYVVATIVVGALAGVAGLAVGRAL